jgi:hypothetical protein
MNLSPLVTYPCTPGTQSAIVHAVMKQRSSVSLTAQIKEFRTELDSHTDTCVIGKNAMVFHETHRYVQVSPFSDSLGILSHVPVVSAAVAYDDHNTGETILLRIHQALLIDDMETNLLCPMQMRMNDVKVDEVPKFLAENPNDQTHALCFPNEQGYTIPLSLKGVTSCTSRRGSQRWMSITIVVAST